MMRGVSTWAVAVRKPAPEQLRPEGLEPEEAPLGEIEVSSFPLVSVLKRHRLLRLPVVRGVVALGESLGDRLQGAGHLGQRPGPGGRAGDLRRRLGRHRGRRRRCWRSACSSCVPVGLTSLIKDQLGSSLLFWLVEGILRTAIFLGYLALLSRMRDLRRVFEYHGAEHKTISCFEAGLPLTPETAQRFSRLHPRCGTSFLLIVMIVAIFVFAPIGLPAWWLLMITRVVGVPLIAGISFEIIKFAGRNRSRGWVRALMWPGMQLQLLTTREPDHDQLAVAIAAMEAVLAVEDPRAAGQQDMVGIEVVA